MLICYKGAGAGAKFDHQRIGVRARVRANLDLDVRGACVRRKKRLQPMPQKKLIGFQSSFCFGFLCIPRMYGMVNEKWLLSFSFEFLCDHLSNSHVMLTHHLKHYFRALP